MRNRILFAAALLCAVPLIYNAPQIVAAPQKPTAEVTIHDDSFTGGANILTSSITVDRNSAWRLQVGVPADGSNTTFGVVLDGELFLFNDATALTAGNLYAFTFLANKDSTINLQNATTTRLSVTMQSMSEGQ